MEAPKCRAISYVSQCLQSVQFLGVGLDQNVRFAVHRLQEIHCNGVNGFRQLQVFHSQLCFTFQVIFEVAEFLNHRDGRFMDGCVVAFPEGRPFKDVPFERFDLTFW